MARASPAAGGLMVFKGGAPLGETKRD
jgi:hypothetical protein